MTKIDDRLNRTRLIDQLKNNKDLQFKLRIIIAKTIFIFWNNRQVIMDFFKDMRKSGAPLSERMRATDLSQFIGQKHLIKEGSLLFRAIMADRLGNCIFYGPPGSGKTTLAHIIAITSNAESVYLNAVSSGVSDVKKVISEAINNLELYGKKTYLLLDECHRWSKAQSDSLLSAMEKGEIVFIGSTTENPYVSMTPAIVSRCRVFEFHELSTEEVLLGLNRALTDPIRGLAKYAIDIAPEVLRHLAISSNGDLRVALDSLELAVITTPVDVNLNKTVLTQEIIEEVTQKRVITMNESDYYDFLSAFCKSIRGGDPDAAVYYSMRILNAGYDPRLLARRLIIHAAEDVGLADTNALNVSVNALTAIEKIGMPEGAIILTEAIIYVSLAPKSNSVVRAITKVSKVIEKTEKITIPSYLLDNTYKKNPDMSYKYPHDYGGWVEQQYLPNEIKDEKFYIPSHNGAEEYIIKINRKNGGH